MGNANQTGNRDQSQTIQAIKGWPLLFHQTHSTNVQLSPDQRRAKRLETFCNGICFSNRPVSIGEQVILRFAEVSTSWSGVLRFGFTSHDPSSIDAAGLPRYACPDLTNKYGYWAKALPERFALQGNILCFHVCRNGSVMYAINGEDRGLFFGGIAVGQPLWALVDIYGNSTSVEFIDPRLILSLPLKDNCSPTLTSTSNFFTSLEQGQQVHQGQRAVIGQQVMAHSLKHNQTHQEHQTNNLNLHHYNQQQQRSLMALGGRTTDRSAGLPDATSAPRSSTPPVRHHKNLSPLPFHGVAGKNVRLSPDRLVATRIADEYCNGYVFSSRPFKPGEKIVVQILSLDEIFTGGIAFGMTSCDVSLLSPGDLPDDADLLLDRPEYWVVNKDVCSNPAVGDELSFLFTNEGEIKYGKNGFNISTLMHVDKEVKLWAFFDVYGNAQRIRVLGVAAHSIQSSAINTSQQQQQQQQQQQLQQQQGMQYHQNLIEEIFQPSFTLNSELTYHRGNVHNPLVQLPSVCPQQREENADNAPPRPPPPIKKPAIPQPQQIPALPPKQVRSGAAFEERLGTRNSPSSGIVQSQPLSPSRGALPYDALSVSSLDNSESGDSRHLFSCQNSSYLQFKEMQPAACRDQGLHRFPIAPKSAPPIQRPPVTAPKPTSLLRSSATFKTPNRRLENASLPVTSAEFPPYFATSPRLSDRILALTQHRTMKERAPPTPTPRSSIRDVNTSQSDPTVRKNIQRGSTTPNSEVATSMDVNGDASALGMGSDDPSAHEESLSSSGEIRENNECSVCWERIPDCALYTCGHMCMCYDCALALKESRDAQCPICRQPIKDIIKIYRS